MDLLHEESPALTRPPRAADLKRLSERLTFAFARGTEEGDLVQLGLPQLAEASVSRECFEGDLFLDELLDGCFSVTAGGRRYDSARAFQRRLLAEPPKNSADTLFRQRIFSELAAQPELTLRLEQAYVELRAFRLLLCAGDRMTGAQAALRRRVDILIALRRTVLLLAQGFGQASSGLARLDAWARALSQSEEFSRLTRLLSFEEQRLVLKTELSIGYDGTLRRFDIVDASQATYPGFSGGSGSRIWRRIRAWLRGYRFSEEDVMSQLLDQIFTALEGDVIDLLGLTVQLEFYLAGLGFRRFAEKSGQEVCLPVFVEDERELLGLFNPWLLAQAQKAVPCDLGASEARSTVILTGPNSGGKTRFLQAIAIVQLLGQVGSFVPARSARLVWVEQIFLSLIERPEADQKEGRLGMELLRIRKVFETSGPHSLIVMDELCSGTNPSEGEEIFEMVLELLDELHPQVFISTHFLDFAARLVQKNPKNLAFLQVELAEHERPTYQFVPGVAQTSLAQTTASRLGVTRDELLRLVEARRAQG